MSTIERAVFDTNILISAYLWSGTPRHALELVSAMPAVEELVRVLGYHKFGFSPKEIAPFAEDLLSLVELVEPMAVEEVVADPTDNLFLGIAAKGKCQAIVSGDHHLLNLGQFRGIGIIAASEFVRRVRRR